MTKINASVIIPTYNRLNSLTETLNSLSKQSYPQDQFEVVVVDDGSTDGTEAIPNTRFPFSLRYICQENQGSAIARNTGAENACGDILIFVDDDIWANSDYVRGLVKEHQLHNRIVGMGTFKPYISNDTTPFLKIYADLTIHKSDELQTVEVDFTHCVTNNLSVRRDDFFEIGMMQDVAGDGPTWWGDVDFGYRAYQLGFRFRQSGKATCIHRDYSIKDLSIASKRAEEVANMVHALFQKHPGIQDFLPMFHDKIPIIWKQDSPRLVARKLSRQVGSTNTFIRSMEQMVTLLETHYPNPTMLRPLYRWIIGGYIHRGYRQGLKEYGPVLDTVPDNIQG